MDKYKNNSGLDKLQRKLYSPNETFDVTPQKALKEKKYEFEEDWGSPTDEVEDTADLFEAPKKKRFNLFGILFVLAFLFFAGSVGYGLFVFFQGVQSVSGNDVDITIVGPVQIGGGETLALDIIVQNNNQIPLEDVNLIVEYPDGTKDVTDLRTDLKRDVEELGSVSASSVVKKTKRSALFGEEGSNKQIEVRVEYHTQDSTAIFEKKKLFDVVLQSAPLRMTVQSVGEITSNQELTFEVEVSSNSSSKLEDVMVTAEYPFGFKLEDASYETVDGNNVWNLGSLDPKAKKVLLIKGRLEGQNDEERIFRFNTGLADQISGKEIGVIFSSLLQSVTIRKPFFGIDMKFDGSNDEEIVAKAGNRIVSEVIYTNNLNDSIFDAEIELTISGQAISESSINANGGFYQSANNTIVWNSNTSNSFDELSPRRQGKVSFDFSSVDLRNMINPEITFDAKVTGRRVSENNVSEEIVSTVFKRVKFAPSIRFDANSFFGAGPIENTGTVPPKAEVETTYTIQWDLFNTSSLVSGTKVTGNLPEYVSWGDEIYPISENITFDPITRIVTWNVGDLEAGTGYSKDKASAAFKVKLLPSLTQVGSSPTLIRDMKVVGQDTFTKTSVSATYDQVNISAKDLNPADNTDIVVK